MELVKHFFILCPGDDEIGGGGITLNNDDTNSDEARDVAEKEKSLKEKIHDALQEWSNDDQRDQDIDDRTP